MSNEPEFQTYTHALLSRLENCPKRNFIHLVDDKGQVEDICYQKLFLEASKYASKFTASGVSFQDRVLIILPTGRGFISSYFACYLLGACPVPAYPPFRLYDVDAYIKNLAYIIKNAEPAVVVAFSLAKEIIQSAINLSGHKVPLLLEEKLEKDPIPNNFEPTLPKTSDLALIQYTSGSTGQQKGVCLSFYNLLINNMGTKQHGPLTEDDVQVSNLPLIGGFINTMINGILDITLK